MREHCSKAGSLNFRDLKFQIILLGIVLVAAGTAVRHFYVLPMFQKQIRETVLAQQASVAEYAARDVRERIATRSDLIGRLAAAIPADVVADPQRLQAWLMTQQRINSIFGGGLIGVPVKQAQAYAHVPLTGEGHWQEFQNKEWVRRAIDSTEPVAAVPGRDPRNDKGAMVFASSVRDARGEAVMIIAGVSWLDAPGFLGVLQQTAIGETGGFVLLSMRDKLIVAATDPARRLIPLPDINDSILKGFDVAAGLNSGVIVNSRGVEELSVVRPVGKPDWLLIARVPAAEVLYPIANVREFMFRATGVFLLVICAILFVTLPRILRPLTQAARDIHAMADGLREIEPIRVQRNDEIGSLLKHFNELVYRLHKEEGARLESERRLKFMAHHDALTGLCNRFMLIDRLEQALARTERDGTCVALLFCDLDGFKSVNDRYGHEIGDAVLKEVAARLSSRRRKVDTVARLGGDEFVLLLTCNSEPRRAAKVVAQSCLREFDNPFVVNNTQICLGLSIGIALHTGTQVTPSQLISQADVAMYRAKRDGKGRFFFIDPATVQSHESACDVVA